jgi:hypothetical protein
MRRTTRFLLVRVHHLDPDGQRYIEEALTD